MVYLPSGLIGYAKHVFSDEAFRQERKIMSEEQLHEYPKGGRQNTLTDAHIIQIMRWKAENLSDYEMARRLHVTEKTIRRHVKFYMPPSRTRTPEENESNG